MQSPNSSPESLNGNYFIPQTTDGPIYSPEDMDILQGMLDEADRKIELARLNEFPQQIQMYQPHTSETRYPSGSMTDNSLSYEDTYAENDPIVHYSTIKADPEFTMQPLIGFEGWHTGIGAPAYPHVMGTQFQQPQNTLPSAIPGWSSIKKSFTGGEHSFIGFGVQDYPRTMGIPFGHPSHSTTLPFVPTALNFVHYVPSAMGSTSARPMKKTCSSSQKKRQTTARKHASFRKTADTREKKFPCGFPGCKQGCNTSSDLKRHAESHGPPKFRCMVGECAGSKKKYARTDSLKRHQEQQHGM